MSPHFFDKTNRHRIHFLVLLLFSMAAMINIMTVYGQNIDLKKSPEDQLEQEISQEEKELAKERDLKIAFILLSGIIFIGGFAILLLIIWGYRVRRVIREPLPHCQKVDPLWFLKSTTQDQEENEEGPPPSKEVSEESGPDEQSE
jgi:hypothetical protein